MKIFPSKLFHESFVFRLESHWNVFLKVQLTVSIGSGNGLASLGKPLPDPKMTQFTDA